MKKIKIEDFAGLMPSSKLKIKPVPKRKATIDSTVVECPRTTITLTGKDAANAFEKLGFSACPKENWFQKDDTYSIVVDLDAVPFIKDDVKALSELEFGIKIGSKIDIMESPMLAITVNYGKQQFAFEMQSPVSGSPVELYEQFMATGHYGCDCFLSEQIRASGGSVPLLPCGKKMIISNFRIFGGQ